MFHKSVKTMSVNQGYGYCMVTKRVTKQMLSTDAEYQKGGPFVQDDACPYDDIESVIHFIS